MSKLSEAQSRVMLQLAENGPSSMAELRSDGRTVSSLISRRLITGNGRRGDREIFRLTIDGHTIAKKLGEVN